MANLDALQADATAKYQVWKETRDRWAQAEQDVRDTWGEWAKARDAVIAAAQDAVMACTGGGYSGLEDVDARIFAKPVEEQGQ